MKHKIGTNYICTNCGYKLDFEANSLLFWDFPIGRKIKECPRCKKKYVSRKLEFFETGKADLYIFWGSQIIPKIIIIYIILFLCELPKEKFILANIIIIALTIIYSLYIISKWNKAIGESISRIEDTDYLSDLIEAKIINLDKVKELYQDKIISEEEYNYFCNSKSEKKDNNKAKVNEGKTIKYCTECGCKIDPKWKLCHECGNKLK